jgi:hypothetical protein
MPRVVFEPTNLVFERAKTFHAPCCAATVIVFTVITLTKIKLGTFILYRWVDWTNLSLISAAQYCELA